MRKMMAATTISAGHVLNRRPTVMIRFVCELCGEEIDVQDQLSGRQIKCPKCKSIRIVPDKSPKIKFHCKSCGHGIRAAQIDAGKKGICPNCKKPVVIPSHPEGSTVALVCSICNEMIHVPEDSKEEFIKCPKCGSFVQGLHKDV
jgi:DNA-directed RNA polymerase subunit RPC12/RpoP